MKQIFEKKGLVSAITLSLAIVVGSFANTFAVSGQSQQPSSASGPPAVNKQFTSGKQDKAPIEPGSKDAAKTAPLGQTSKTSKVNADGTPASTTGTVSALAGYVSGVDFSTFYNYCYRNLLYTTIVNTTASTQYAQVQLYNEGTYRSQYVTLAAGTSYTYPAFYGVNSTYYAYLYVWNGSSYAYDEYKGGALNCSVGVSTTYNSAGWVQLRIQNYGTAYATQISKELAPTPTSGTYTGTQYDYPSPGSIVYRWFYVGYLPYGITSWTYGSFNYPYNFTGDH